jgi:hypothetical protein
MTQAAICVGCCVFVAENACHSWVDVAGGRPAVRLCCCFRLVRGPFPSYFHPLSSAVVDVVDPTNPVRFAEDGQLGVVIVPNADSSIDFPLWLMPG